MWLDDSLHFLPLPPLAPPAPGTGGSPVEDVAPEVATHPVPEPCSPDDEDDEDDEELWLPLLPDPEPLPLADEPADEPDVELDVELDVEPEPEPLPAGGRPTEPLDPLPGSVPEVELLPDNDEPLPNDDDEPLDDPRPPSRPADCLLTNETPASPCSTVEPGMRSGEQPTATAPSRATAMRYLEEWRVVIGL